MNERITLQPYTQPAGGWGSIKAVGTALQREHVLLAGSRALLQQNKPGGFACVSCAWAKPANPRPAEFCENGAKATAWELTTRRLDPAFFEAHTVAELMQWSDHELEAGGRLTVPLRYDTASDRYVEVSWDDAIAEIGRELAALREEDARSVVFYASGRASLETSYMYQLLARLYGNNNLPDSSNMCHESTSVALPQTIGVPIGTVTLDDFEHADAIFIFGQNTGVSSPRMLHQLQEARRRDVPIVTFNPLRERGLESFANPQSPLEMLTPAQTQVSTQYHTLRVGGDLAALAGMAKLLVAWDAQAKAQGTPRVLDVDFLETHTDGFDEFAQWLDSLTWAEIERESGLTQQALNEAALTYAKSRAVILIYGMGLTQHRMGVNNVQMLSNLMLLRGNVGKPGAGICPVRGHSNVQGQRTVGITEKPELAPLDQLEAMYGFKAPREPGLSTVGLCEGLLDGRVRGFIGLGGNLVRAAPDTERLLPAWRRLRLSVHVATKLNKAHLVPGAVSFLLPCLGRIEIDRQATGEQKVAVEDSTGFIHASRGVAEPAAPGLRSEAAIVAALAQACLPPNPKVPWQDWVDDYSRVRDAIARTFPDVFHDFNQRMDVPGGFSRPVPARHREWKTDTGKANFRGYGHLVADPDAQEKDDTVLRLTTVRSDDQFNTTVYSLDDRFRGIYGSRDVLLINTADIDRLGLAAEQMVQVCTAVNDGVERRVNALRLVPYDIPPGCVAGYFPECNALVPLWHHAHGSQVPGSKSIPVRLRPMAVAA
ncbi:MAG: FdhF/YdeP family oxidoreductase [Comamonadaceae bacterium]|nr:MAG: FdhF/YdeP family oxidoreductase [Comamonadaceae bacterium]